jgi:hypothetical protein
MLDTYFIISWNISHCGQILNYKIMNCKISIFSRGITGVCIALALVLVSISTDAQQRLTFTPVVEAQYTLSAGANAFAAKATTLNVTGSAEAVGTPSSIRDGSGNIHIVFVDKVAGDQYVLRYVRQKGISWESAEVDRLGSASQEDGRFSRGLEKQIPTLAIDNNGTLHFTYFKVESSSIKLYCGSINLARGAVSKAAVETISSNTSYQNGLAIDRQNIIHISYHNEGLKYANNKSGRFVPTMLKANEDNKPNFVERGVNSTMLIQPNGDILIPYQGTHHRNWVVVAEFLDCQAYSGGVWKNMGIVGSLGTLNTNGFNIFMENGSPTLYHYAGGTLGYAQYTGRWTKRTFGLGSETLSSALSATATSNGKSVVAWYSRNGDLFVSHRNGDSWSSKLVGGIKQYGDAFPIVVPSTNGKVEVFVRANVQGKGTLVRVVER